METIYINLNDLNENQLARIANILGEIGYEEDYMRVLKYMTTTEDFKNFLKKEDE